MHNRERFVIYGLLAGLLVVNLSGLVGRTTTPALADDLPSDLVPTPAIALAGEDGAKTVVLRNRDGHLAWGDEAYDHAYSTSYVYIGEVLKSLMQSEELRDERERLVSELSETDTEFRERLEGVGAELKEMDPESDEAREKYQEGTAIYQEYQGWQQESLVTRGRLDAAQLERAYREMIEAVEVVADRKGIDIVYRFIPTDEEFSAETPEQALTAIRLRTALRYPKELDLTADVLEELSLEVE